MARLNLNIDADLLKRFREAANKKFSKKHGHTKGALKAAVEEAIMVWLNAEEPLQDEKLIPVETEGS